MIYNRFLLLLSHTKGRHYKTRRFLDSFACRCTRGCFCIFQMWMKYVPSRRETGSFGCGEEFSLWEGRRVVLGTVWHCGGVEEGGGCTHCLLTTRVTPFKTRCRFFREWGFERGSDGDRRLLKAECHSSAGIRRGGFVTAHLLSASSWQRLARRPAVAAVRPRRSSSSPPLLLLLFLLGGKRE